MILHDKIIEKIHKIRQEYSQSFNHDLKAIFADLQKQQSESKREVVNLSSNDNPYRGITATLTRCFAWELAKPLRLKRLSVKK